MITALSNIPPRKVCLFEPRSFLERVTQNWEYQELLIAAAACTDPADRLRYVVAFACSGLCRQISFHKPFNPILGETYQAKYANGVEVYCEQISHHPPVSSWQVYEPSGKVCGYFFCGFSILLGYQQVSQLEHIF